MVFKIDVDLWNQLQKEGFEICGQPVETCELGFYWNQLDGFVRDGKLKDVAIFPIEQAKNLGDYNSGDYVFLVKRA